MKVIDIVIPVYNQAHSLLECLDSIRKQTFQDYTITIVNDGSTDDIQSVLQNLDATDIIYIEQKNKGAAAARNRGARHAKASYLLFCDADIVMKPDMLESMVNALKKNSEIMYVYSSFFYGLKKFKPGKFSVEKLQQGPFIHTTSLLKKESFVGFDESLKRFQDWDLFLTMSKKGYYGEWIPKCLYTIKTHGTISKWLPSFAYKWLSGISSVKEYNNAVKIVKDKHKLL